ncbi:hypothetical protein GJU40_03755 [Bacillus lacus]|uniref:Spore coat protein n=2 Tax=Metabacillus lacus TaxID=1983721 RepID=A0A7X2LXH0_9BACI|nr:hypothetical protein [Metabacillus lacus]
MNMRGPFQQPFGRGMGNMGGMGGMQQFRQMGMGQQFPYQQAPVKTGGLKGMISKILPGGGQNAANAAGGAARSLPGIGGVPAIGGVQAAAGSAQGISGLMNPQNISGMLGNVQKVLGMAQQVTPMVQQYGPLVRNLPAMMKIYSELKNTGSDSNEENSTEQEAPPAAQPVQISESTTAEIDYEDAPQEVQEPRAVRSGASRPRLYV